MMNLYRFEVETDSRSHTVIVVAKDDEQAFKAAEIEIEKHFLKLPEVKEITLLERKIIRSSAATVIG